jgi:hypothetical protein
MPRGLDHFGYLDGKPNITGLVMRISLKLETCDMLEYHNIFKTSKTFDKLEKPVIIKK